MYICSYIYIHIQTLSISKLMSVLGEKKANLQEARCRAQGPGPRQELWTRLSADDYTFQRWRLGQGFIYKAKL